MTATAIQSRIIAIANQKGGVGKTTTAVNLAACLALSGHPTLLVDLDPQSNATVGLGFTPDRVQNSIYHVLIDGVPLKEAIHKSDVPGLDLVPSDIALAAAEVELAGREHRETILRKGLNEVRHLYQFILVDCPPSLGLINLNGLAAADSVLIPVQAEYYAMTGVALLLNTLALVQRELNPHLRVEGALLTMVDSRAALSQQVVDEVQKMFRDRVYATTIPRSVRLAEAPSHGKPISLYDPKGKGTESYAKVAAELLKKAGY
jgi:chromosome partitioning protein